MEESIVVVEMLSMVINLVLMFSLTYSVASSGGQSVGPKFLAGPGRGDWKRGCAPRRACGLEEGNTNSLLFFISREI